MTQLTEQAAQQARQRLLIGCDDMIAALEALLSSKKAIAEQIHSLRKLGKTLRGGSTLFGARKTAAREIQAVGRLLSERRDATSRRKTWDKLKWKPRHPSARAIVGLLNQQVTSAARKSPKATVIWCVARIAAAKAALAEIREESLLERLQDGIAQLEKQLAKRGKRIDRRGEEDFHDFRKSIKALLGARKFLPEIPHPHAVTLHKIADILGDENDLATLTHWLTHHGFTEKMEPDLWKKIEKSREKLQDEVVELLPHLRLDESSE